jgi:hypothetical protein
MNAKRLIPLAALLAAALSFPIQAQTKKDLEAAMAAEGLQPAKSKDLDMLYMRPGASLAGYKKVMLDPVEVSFSKDWDPTRPGSKLKVGPTERENIRAGVAKITYDQFARLLAAKDGYPVVTAAGEDVLRAKVRIINLYVNATDPNASNARTRSYTMSAGEATLFLDIFDSETGQILARAIDRREARTDNRMTLSNSVINTADAEDLAAQWARILRKALDKARAATAAKQGAGPS